MPPSQSINTGHGGNVHGLARDMGIDVATLLDFSANINPLGPPEWLRPLISREVANLVHYPDPYASVLVSAIAARYQVPEESVVVANGTTELLYQLPKLLGRDQALIPCPSYIDYAKVMVLAGMTVRSFLLTADHGFSLDPQELAPLLTGGELVVIGTPNNPTGVLVDPDQIIALAKGHPATLFLVDEAFLDFVEGGGSVAAGHGRPSAARAMDGRSVVAGHGRPSAARAMDGRSVALAADNIMTLHSLTKFYAIPGLRLGFGIFPLPIARLLREHLPPWTVNTLAQAVGVRALADQEYGEQSRALCSELRTELVRELQRFPALQLFDSAANYLLLRLKDGSDARTLAGHLLERRIMIRTCANYTGLDASYFRIAVRTAAENSLLLQALSEILQRQPRKSAQSDSCHTQEKNSLPPGGGGLGDGHGRHSVAGAMDGAGATRGGGCHESTSLQFNISKTFPPRRPLSCKTARPLMFQGTSSNAGKSVLTAALCRILLQDGVRVAPFKAQNMSLNSFVTRDGLEMGRAQVVQAQAARLDPDIRMNPVLLKPNSDTGSQVIVHGRPVGNMDVMTYLRYKETAMQAAHASYDSLAADYDVILLEGAGSPGEVNLKRHDIVNMGMARYAQSPVLLVGDIDRGGVYASFVGTMEVLNEWERALVAGFVVNRFRGQASLLQSAHDYVAAHTGREVLGVVPYLKNLGLPEEDSVSFKDGLFQSDRPKTDHVEIALISLPHISNFTDIEPLAAEPDVYLRVVERAEDLGNPQAIILPGSKNVIHDLAALASYGLAAAIQRQAAAGCEIIGVCGGYQMLGNLIEDPLAIESDQGAIAGLGLLPMTTVLAADKKLTRQHGVHTESGQPVHGYEIHHGRTQSDLPPTLAFTDGSGCGASNASGQIWGSYLHGIFDSDPFRRWFINRLRQRKGLSTLSGIPASYDLEPAFDRLAATVRESVDMSRIYQLLGL
ncbi:MAG: cobyric acid synthase [Desulfocapsaceae bacterium]|nr:cobyric acid synthase [Desulfocapsaceae bacterium]